MNNLYYKTKESVDEYIRMADGVDGKALIEKFGNFLKPDSRVLEIGSGPGTDWNILSKSYSVVGSDNSTEFLHYLKVNNPNGEFLELDATTLITDSKFDGIYSNKVLHHLSDEELQASVVRQSELLNPNGIICHSFWKGEGDEVFKGLFVNYHSGSGLSNIFGDDFEILVLEEYAEFEDGDSILLIGRRI